jgi:alkanesulfonate monooxygenase SsuD/methylene tetrahydromethanopterin reductase-like flavin-dependent oxidoreductase (luciferase family)
MTSFGISVAPLADDLDRVVRLVRIADEAGLELAGVQDHPYQRRFLDTLALLGHLLDRTERISVFPDVANLPLRPPAVLAKHAATLDRLSGGRFELGLGAGGFWEAIRAMGGPDRTPGESVDALSEAIDVIRAVWSDERSVRYDGAHYRLDGYHPGPPPAHPIGIWLGAYKPRMLRLTGEKADGWVPSLRQGITPADLGELDRRVTDAAVGAGRDPKDVRRVWNVMGASDDPRRFADDLATWATEHGADTFVLWPDGEDQEGQVERFAAEVAPAVRDAIGAR